MPPPDPTDAFLAHLARCDLLTASQYTDIAAWVAEYRPDPSTLAKELTRRGWLTGYQVKEIYKGRSKDLIVGPYRVLDLLGEGGMGRVFKAHHTRLGRDVALKVIRKEKLSNPVAVQRFHQEVRAAAALQHPNVVLAFDADEADGLHFFSMELVDGTDLTKLVRQNGPMPVELACDAVRQGALGLQHAFERGLVHRDIKPSNLIMTPKRQVKLLDLGLALLHEPTLAGGANANRVTQEGFVLGTPDFLAPEQAQNPGGVDIRADIYGLGATLFYLLTGKVPYEGANPTEKLLKHITEPPPSLLRHLPAAPPQLDALIQWMMAKRPADRPQTPAQAAAALMPFCPPQSGSVPMADMTAMPGGPPTGYAQPEAARPGVPLYPHAVPMMPMPVAIPMPADAFAQEPAGAPAFTGFDAAEDEGDERLRRKRGRDDDEEDRPARTKPGAMKVRASKTGSSWPMYLLLGGGGLAVLVILVVVGVYFANREEAANRPLDPRFAAPSGAEMVLIQPGKFRMGSEPNEAGRGEEEGPARDVTLTKAFYMSVTEVTRDQYLYKQLMSEQPSMVRANVGKLAPQLPNDGVTWTDAATYCKKLTEHLNRAATSEKAKHGWRPGWAFRLPTEAEWEYCCRAGTRTPFATGDRLMLEKEAMFQWDDNDTYGTEKSEGRRPVPRAYHHPVVATKPADKDPNADVLYRTPNAFGLIDMHGNLWEWCQDNYSPAHDGATTDPTGPTKPDKANWKVLRGGSWRMPAAECRSASRKGAAATDRANDIGFRIVYAPVAE